MFYVASESMKLTNFNTLNTVFFKLFSAVTVLNLKVKTDYRSREFVNIGYSVSWQFC